MLFRSLLRSRHGHVPDAVRVRRHRAWLASSCTRERHRDRIYAKRLDDSIRALGLDVLRSPFASPRANAICERVIGTIRRECLDWMIPMSEAHLRSILREWVTHYNRGRPHSALAPGVPDPPTKPRRIPKPESRHRLPAAALVLAKSVLGGLHREYSIAPTPAAA